METNGGAWGKGLINTRAPEIAFASSLSSSTEARSRQMGRSVDAWHPTELPGVRLPDDILAHKPDVFYDVWRTAEIGALNRELVLQVHLMARTTAEKFAALRKVYNGLLILIVLTAIFIALLGLHAVLPGIV
jgi:hypothetical protein